MMRDASHFEAPFIDFRGVETLGGIFTALRVLGRLKEERHDSLEELAQKFLLSLRMRGDSSMNYSLCMSKTYGKTMQVGGGDREDDQPHFMRSIHTYPFQKVDAQKRETGLRSECRDKSVHPYIQSTLDTDVSLHGGIPPGRPLDIELVGDTLSFGYQSGRHLVYFFI